MNNCDLCNRIPIKSGKDKLLFEDDFCYVVENGNPNGFYARISLTLIEHITEPDIATIGTAKSVLRQQVVRWLSGKYRYWWIQKTMKTYPDHYHIHACIM